MQTRTELASSVQDLIEHQANINGGAPALLSPGRRPMTYAGLSKTVRSIAAMLASAGITRRDCVALAIPNGPEILTAFLGVASSAMCAPINPTFQGPEFEASFDSLNARAVIVPDGDSVAREVARRRGIPAIDLLPSPNGHAGEFTLRLGARQVTIVEDGATAQDIALLLHTSGTTSTAKLVPLTHGNILAGAGSIERVHGLTANDRLLSVMQLFHIAGLGLCLASLRSGGSVFITPGFQISKFSLWLQEADPTWFWASPTILRELIERTSRDRTARSASRLRFIRVGSSALSAELMVKAEEVFRVPVIANYGMTEASPQITCNPMLPRSRKLGSVGMEAGPQVGILGSQGEMLPAKRVGEIVIKGPNVMLGYLRTPKVNQTAFVNGWFRTGDLGYKDEEGYLFLTGRIKEMINRGGEKISPLEVDEVLLKHPAIQDAVTFAFPHPKLGEEVAAAIVLREGFPTRAAEIQEYVARNVASFKVPRRILFVGSLPKGPTGKIKRVGLAEVLGLADLASDGPNVPQTYVAPRDALEHQLTKIWEDVLHVKPVGVTDDFVELGGYSLLAMELIEKIQHYGKTIPVVDLLQGTNVEQQARILRGHVRGVSASPLVPIKPTGKRPPLFCVHRLAGTTIIFRPLAEFLDKEQPLYALQAKGLTGDRIPHDRIEDMAAFYVKLVRGVQAVGPYFVAGASFGGIVALEMARQLLAQGEEVDMLGFFDTGFPVLASRTMRQRVAGSLGHWLKRIAVHAHKVVILPPHEKLLYVKERMKTGRGIISGRNRTKTRLPLTIQEVVTASRRALRYYRPQVYPGRITLFRALDEAKRDSRSDATLGWSNWAAGGVEVIDVPGDHLSMLDHPHVQVLASRLNSVLTAAQDNCTRSMQAV